MDSGRACSQPLTRLYKSEMSAGETTTTYQLVPGNVPLSVKSSTAPLETKDLLGRSPLNLKAEEDRRKTFETWSVSFLAPEKLAAAGFYYLRREDIVRCVFCGVEIGRWEEGDDPFIDHQRWSPTCPYLRKVPVGNIPVDPINPIIVPDNNNFRSCDTCGLQDVGFVQSSVLECGGGQPDQQCAEWKLAIHRRPLYSQYSSLEARLRSYENSWPLSMGQRPDKLSEAGFFYTGKGDQTVCFHCGGCLKDWQSTDDPFVEHALWYPKCTYIFQLKGKAFVDSICEEKEALVATKEFRAISR